jgi:23S rRNA pseudouridine2605 synthase
MRELIRLNKFLRDAGVASRRKVDEIIKEGGIKVNGVVVTHLGVRIDPKTDVVEFQGRRLEPVGRKIYGILNKPFGVVSTMSDPEGRPCVGDLLRPLGIKVFLVGRLDFDTMGLLPFTNDGQWAHRLLHPRYHVPRTYKATINGLLSESDVERLKKGVALTDGTTQGAKVSVLKKAEDHSILRITVFEGRNRLVRRLFEALGYKVIHLIRIGFGPLTLGDLKVGQYKLLEKPPTIKA